MIVNTHIIKSIKLFEPSHKNSRKWIVKSLRVILCGKVAAAKGPAAQSMPCAEATHTKKHLRNRQICMAGPLPSKMLRHLDENMNRHDPAARLNFPPNQKVK